MMGMAMRAGLLLALAAMTGGCAAIQGVAGGAPPADAEVARDLADQAAGNRLYLKLDSVGKNVAFAETLIGLYDARSERLRDTDYITTLPLYAAGVAAGILALHDVNKTTLLDIGIGAGAYYGLTSSLNFAGRAQVLQDATQNWQCFADTAAQVRFLDGKAGGGDDSPPVLGAKIAHDYDNLHRAILTGRAYMANGVALDDATSAALANAVKAAVAVEPAAAAIRLNATQADRVLARYRRAILRQVAIAYSGQRQPFAYKAFAGSNSLDQYVTFRAAVEQTKAVQAGQDAGAVLLDPANGQSADSATADLDKTLADAKASGQAKVRAVIYRLTELSLRFSTDPDYVAVGQLPAQLEKCVP